PDRDPRLRRAPRASGHRPALRAPGGPARRRHHAIVADGMAARDTLPLRVCCPVGCPLRPRSGVALDTAAGRWLDARRPDLHPGVLAVGRRHPDGHGAPPGTPRDPRDADALDGGTLIQPDDGVRLRVAAPE